MDRSPPGCHSPPLEAFKVDTDFNGANDAVYWHQVAGCPRASSLLNVFGINSTKVQSEAEIKKLADLAIVVSLSRYYVTTVNCDGEYEAPCENCWTVMHGCVETMFPRLIKLITVSNSVPKAQRIQQIERVIIGARTDASSSLALNYALLELRRGEQEGKRVKSVWIEERLGMFSNN